MTVDEKGLLAAMKRAYKGGGYEIAATEYQDEPYLVIHGPGWTIAMLTAETPRKVLGLIAEHLGKIPEPEDGYAVSKDLGAQAEISSMILDMVERDANTLSELEITRENVCERTRLTWQGYNLWQNVGTLRVLPVDPTLEDLVDTQDLPVAVGGLLSWDGRCSRVSILAEPVEEDNPELVFLSGNQWTAQR